MLLRPFDCQGCPLHDNHVAIGYMRPEGTGANGVLFLAEALGEKEAVQGLPLRPNAPAGSVFQGILRRMSGVDRSQFTISNTIWCQPGKGNWLDGAPYEYAAIEHCQRYNAELVRARRPRAIVTLGGIPTRTVTGFSGEKQGIKLIRGFILDSTRPEYYVDGQPVPTIPTYHPSYLHRSSKTRSKDKEVTGKVEKAEGGMGLVGVVTRDIQLAIDIARNGAPAPHKYEARSGCREDMEELIRLMEFHPEWALGWDVETPRSLAKAADESEIDSIKAQILQIQFAFNAELGYIFPGFDVEWVKEGSRKLLSLLNRKYTWNGWKFDDKVVASYDIHPAGENVDLMSAWSWIQPDLPKGLQFATSFAAPNLGPWKHLNQVGDETYGAKDVISLHLNADSIFRQMDTKGLRQSYNRHVLLLRPELVAASRRGFPVDAERHKAWGEKIDKEIAVIEAQFPALVPEAILPVHPKADRKKKQIGVGYVGIPRQIADQLDEEGNIRDGSDSVRITEVIEDTDDDGNVFTETKPVVYTRRLVAVLDRESLEEKMVWRWIKLLPFSANSGPQKLAYIQHKRDEEVAKRVAKGQSKRDAERLAKYKIPMVRDKQTKLFKSNSGMKELEKLAKATGDPLFKLLVDITKLNKLKGTYGPGSEWESKKGYVHTTFGVADTGTGQTTSRWPNIQNPPKHGALAKDFRFCIAAKPGKVLIEIDKKGFHAMTLARRARDKKYQRMAALDVHSFMTAHRLKLPEAPQLVSWSDKDLGAWFATKREEKFLYTAEAVPAFPYGMTFDQVRDNKTKRIVHGLGFSQGPQSILEQHAENFKNKRDVQDYIDIFFAEFDRIKPWQNEVTKQAHKDTHLINAWNYIRHFYDVFKWNYSKWNDQTGTEGAWDHGDDFEAAVAFFPSSEAFGMIKEEILRMAGYVGPDQIWNARDGEDLLRRYGCVNQIHDSVIFHCDEGLKDQCLEDATRIMNEPCLRLIDPVMCPSGFVVGTDASVGVDWTHMEKV